MSRDDLHKLLGGYATGTLTPEEQEALFEAALTDQELFDALAREQALRDLLREPAAKAQVLAALDEPSSRWYQGWGWWRPAAAIVAMAGMAALAVVVFRHAPALRPVMVAQVRPPEVPKSAPANPVELDRPAVPVRQKALAARQPVQVVPEGRPVFRPAVPPPEAAPATIGDGLRAAGRGGGGGSRGPALKPAPAAPATAAESAAPMPRDLARPGIGGGVSGGIPMATPFSPPAAPVAETKKEVQATTADSLVVAPVTNARALYYQAPVFAQAFAPSQEKKAEPSVKPPAKTPAPAAAAGSLSRARLQAAANVLQEPQAPNPGVRYRILRPGAINGQPAAPTITVELTPNDDGMLSVTSGGQIVLSRPVTRLTPYTTDPLSAIDRELTVVFTRTAQMVVTGVAARGAQPGNVLHRSEEADGTYVVGEPASTEVRFTIRVSGQ